MRTQPEKVTIAVERECSPWTDPKEKVFSEKYGSQVMIWKGKTTIGLMMLRDDGTIKAVKNEQIESIMRTVVLLVKVDWEHRVSVVSKVL